jgi:hypothetical protein
MINGTHDNLLDLIKLVDSQNLQYVFAVWSPNAKDKYIDKVTVYTSFEKNELVRLSEALRMSEPDIEIKKNK